MITLSEQNRRMQEMMKMYGMGNMGGMDMGGDSTLILFCSNCVINGESMLWLKITASCP